MKKLFYLFSLLAFWGIAGCDDYSDVSLIPEIIPTEKGSDTYVLQGYEDVSNGFNVFKPEESDIPFYLKNGAFYGERFGFLPADAVRLDAMAEASVDGAWSNEAAVVPGKCYWARYGEFAEYKYMKLRVAYAEGNNVGIEYVLTSQISAGPNVNCNYAFMEEYPASLELEIPAISEANGIYREHYVDYAEQHIMNLATSWNAELRHSAWVAFYFDKTTAQDNVKRTDKWAWDPSYDADTMGGVEEADHKSDGYDKGHLCASEDRVYCKEANEQTFYYTNISPQIGALNQKYWMYLEQQVQKWGRSTVGGTFDKVYVTKGGTLNKLLTNFTGTIKGGDGKYPTTDADGLTIHGLAVPAYYFMAVLAEKDGEYQAISFLVPHSELLPAKPGQDEFMVYALPVDRLEEETGIDFFCNLPDVIEDAVEYSIDRDAWTW